MGHYIQDLFTVAMGGGSIRRFRDMALVELPDVQLVTTVRELHRVQRWARAMPTSGLAAADRKKLLDELSTMIVHADSADATRGAGAALASLARCMRAGGMDLESWKVPQAVRDELATDATEPAGAVGA